MTKLYSEMNASERTDFEQACLSIGREFLPPCARAVLDGEECSEGTLRQYDAWLEEQSQGQVNDR